jgi:DNA-binding transcriptional LysR family regulator
MEIYELEYFLAVAAVESVQGAARRVHTSPGSLSKAVARLEDELGVALFDKVGRNIRLTDRGRLLASEAQRLLDLAEAVRETVSGGSTTVRVEIAGPETLLLEYGMHLIPAVKRVLPSARVEFRQLEEREALGEVERGASHFALVTAPSVPECATSELAAIEFQTCVGRGHPLWRAASRGETVSIAEVLKHGFVSPMAAILGSVKARQSIDGWRDDIFARRIDFRAASVNMIGRIVSGGHALAYLPEYIVRQLPVSVLKIEGCPYTCKQKVQLAMRRKQDLRWVGDVFRAAGTAV